MNLIVNSKVTFDPILHTYFCEGKELIGVTTLLKNHGLGADYSSIPDSVLAKAAKRGTEIHEIIERYDNGEALEQLSTGYSVGAIAALKAYISLNTQVIASEYLVSDNTLVASKIDKVFTDYSLADIKTTSTLHTEAVQWQLSIYAYLFELQNPYIKVPHLYAIHIRDNRARIQEVNRISDDEIIRLFDCELTGIHFRKPESVIIPEQSKIIRIENEMVRLKSAIAELEDIRKKIYDDIYQQMTYSNQTKIENEQIMISLIKPATRTSIDGPMLRELYPEIAEQCTKVSPVKGSIRIKIKNN